MEESAEAKQLRIKTGILRRLRKELGMYQEEEARERAKVDKLRSEGADPHDIKYAENVLAESSAMIPDTRQRLEAAFQDLEGLLVREEEYKSKLGDSPVYGEAAAEAEAARPLLA